MRDASRSESLSVMGVWRRLNPEQRAAGVGALLVLVSTFGPFSFVEAGEILIAAGVLFLLKSRAERRQFHLPFGDGTVIATAGVWAGILIVVRLFDRSLGQGLLALACAAVVALAGLRERAKRPADDLPPGGPAVTRPPGAPGEIGHELPTERLPANSFPEHPPE